MSNTRTLRKGCRGKDVSNLQTNLNLIPDGIFGNITEEAVKAFQKAHNLTVDGIVGPNTWNAIESSHKKCSRKINKIIIHCSATQEGKDYTVNQIKQWHLARNFSDIGYHYVIYRDGSIHRGRSDDKVGAHTTGYNSNSIGICYIGGLDKNNNPKDTRTEAQKQALVQLIKELKQKYPLATIHGHNEFANKACPSFIVKDDAELNKL